MARSIVPALRQTWDRKGTLTQTQQAEYRLLQSKGTDVTSCGDAYALVKETPRRLPHRLL